MTTDSPDRSPEVRASGSLQTPEPDDLPSTTQIHVTGMELLVAGSIPEGWYDQIMEQFIESDFTMLPARS